MPLFIVLDGFGQAFSNVCENGPNVLIRRKLFMEFCEYILELWIHQEDFLFLLIGKGDIFNYIASSQYIGNDNRYCLKRISLCFIQEIGDLENILNKTLVTRDVKNVYLKDRYQLYSDSDINQAISKIQTVTKGHPKSIYEMFIACKNKEELFSYKGKFKMERWSDPLLVREKKTLH
jgi:hypothetical protein